MGAGARMGHRKSGSSTGTAPTKKGGANDPLEALSESNGLSPCADTTIVLDSDQSGKTLYVRGRDVEEKETAVFLAAGNWSVLGEASEVRRTDERSVIIEALRENQEPMTPGELALGKRINTTATIGPIPYTHITPITEVPKR